MLMGGLDITPMRAINPYLSPIFFYAFVVVLIFVMISMFVTLIMSAYEETK